jgi:hypothetical protein
VQEPSYDEYMADIAAKRAAMLEEEDAALLARCFAHACVRNNTSLEALHGGLFPRSRTGDFSDVKVVTPDREIPWNEVSRISDPEMRTLMREVVNNLFDVLKNQKKRGMTDAFRQYAIDKTWAWDRPHQPKQPTGPKYE